MHLNLPCSTFLFFDAPLLGRDAGLLTILDSSSSESIGFFMLRDVFALADSYTREKWGVSEEDMYMYMRKKDVQDRHYLPFFPCPFLPIADFHSSWSLLQTLLAKSAVNSLSLSSSLDSSIFCWILVNSTSFVFSNRLLRLFPLQSAETFFFFPFPSSIIDSSSSSSSELESTDRVLLLEVDLDLGTTILAFFFCFFGTSDSSPDNEWTRNYLVWKNIWI